MAKLVHKEQSYTGGGSSGLLPHIVITSDAENTITVTTPSGSTITPTSTSSGVWECDVDEYGTYTVDASYSGHDAEETVTVDTVKVYPVEIHVTTVPDGSTVLPTDDIETWLACGQITGKSYTTLSQVLADAETYERLLSDSNACDYMARSTTWASTICADADAMMRLGKYDYACYVLRANNTWNTAINNSSYASYIPSSPTGQTDIIVTAHGGDTVYYMENGSPVTLTTADRDTGIGTVDWSDLPKGAITLYSSTAKNPSDLTADYSKTVYITEYTTQIYLMPDNALYWWGYACPTMGAIASSSTDLSRVAPSLTYNSYACVATQASGSRGQIYFDMGNTLYSKVKITFSASVTKSDEYNAVIVSSLSAKDALPNTGDYKIIVPANTTSVPQKVDSLDVTNVKEYVTIVLTANDGIITFTLNSIIAE